MKVHNVSSDSPDKCCLLPVWTQIFLIYLHVYFSKVSHHPPAAAHHVISQRGWTLWQEITIASKFRGKYLSIMPLGETLLGSEQTKCVNKGCIMQI